MSKILIVEDDLLIAMELAERLADLGHEVLGPAHSIADAEALIARERPRCALLDANVAGQSSVALGVMLTEMGVPLAFCTGYDEIKNLPPALAQAPLMTKPISDADLRAGVSKLLG